MELDSEDEVMLLSVLILKRRIKRKTMEKRKRKRSVWVKDIFKEREVYGDYQTFDQYEDCRSAISRENKIKLFLSKSLLFNIICTNIRM